MRVKSDGIYTTRQDERDRERTTRSVDQQTRDDRSITWKAYLIEETSSLPSIHLDTGRAEAIASRFVNVRSHALGSGRAGRRAKVPEHVSRLGINGS